MTPEQKEKYLQKIDAILLASRPKKWRLVKDLILERHPSYVQMDKDFSDACKELRLKSESKTGASKSLAMRNTMKIPSYLYQALVEFDPELKIEMSGRNHGDQWRIGKQLYKAFPEYRIARTF